jgi:hypothetical protein
MHVDEPHRASPFMKVVYILSAKEEAVTQPGLKRRESDVCWIGLCRCAGSPSR